jgi:RNA polymerase sigma-70 factor (ECF subfamily)
LQPTIGRAPARIQAVDACDDLLPGNEYLGARETRQFAARSTRIAGPSRFRKEAFAKIFLERTMVTLTFETLQDMTLADVVRAARAGDREAFGELVTRFERAVYSAVLRRLGNHAEAQELTQEVFVQAMQRLHQLREPERFGGWLRSIANRMAINRVARRKPVVTTDPAVVEAACVANTTPLDEVLQRERAARLRAGLRRLREMDRETLEAFYMKGHSLREMSLQFDSPIGTIKRRLHVARKRLAKELAAPAGV